MFRVLSCVIYTIISNYVCIGYLGSDKSKLSNLRLGVAGSYKHLGKNMTTYWDSEFQICYWFWPVFISINTIWFLFFRGFIYVSLHIFSYSAASRLSFHSWSNSGWWISLICGVTYVLKMVIIFFKSWNYWLV